ncbi:hypothetical protein CGZ91_04420 [Parenemella sanctibonifatiensis]|uniref:Pyrrolo-quinoline quinone repeat domain-containing protein n=2 Tax=Parenemella sanctibonifatiensis TaxID=2016505 RepID=A0A255EME8_9ACTN|nr:hypothetical protein CGZ91_04420 [Parenemella sanctibonifatiensis]
MPVYASPMVAGRSRYGWSVAVVVLAVCFSVVAAWAVTPRALPDADLAPTDGLQGHVAYAGVPHLQQDHLFVGVSGFMEAGPMLINAWSTVDEAEQQSWWIRRDSGPDSAVTRVREFTEAGIALHVEESSDLVRLWQPALLEVGDLAAGSWSSNGQLVEATAAEVTTKRYRSEATAVRDGECWQISQRIWVENDQRHQSSRWCPDQGEVSRGGDAPSFDFSRAPVPEVPMPPPTGALPAPTPGEPQCSLARHADNPASLLVFPVGGFERLGDNLVAGNRNSNSLVSLDPDLTLRWVRHPGGHLLHLASAGQLVVAGTTTRMVTAWTETGELVWQQQLGEVLAYRPVFLDSGHVLVVTVDGHRSIHRLDTGEVVTEFDGDIGVAAAAGQHWAIATEDELSFGDASGTSWTAARSQAATGVTIVPGSDPLVLVGDDSGGLTAYRSGAELWSRWLPGNGEEILPLAGEGGGQEIVVLTDQGLSVIDSSGEVRWERGGDFHAAVGHGDRVWAVSDADLLELSAGTVPIDQRVRRVAAGQQQVPALRVVPGPDGAQLIGLNRTLMVCRWLP